MAIPIALRAIVKAVVSLVVCMIDRMNSIIQMEAVAAPLIQPALELV